MFQIIYKCINGRSRIINYNNKNGCIEDLYQNFASNEGVPIDSFKLYLNGKILTEAKTLTDNYPNGSLVPITMHHLLVGGKGGFGSMLRAIGAQIEKTTNKEACRDLSGRRLRDINAEKRFKEWVSKKGKDEEEKEKKRKEKLEKMKQTPKIMFEDPNYFKNKDEIPQEVDEALEHGLKSANASQSSEKRKETFDKDVAIKKQKKSLWLGVDLSEDESDEEDDSDSDKKSTEKKSQGLSSDSEKDEASRSTSSSNPGPSSSCENSQQSIDSDQVVPLPSTSNQQISTLTS